MNWKLILQLSMFGLAMGLATVFVIPSNVEPLFWLAIFLISAHQIASRGFVKPFLNGLALGLVNCIWVTAAHMIFVVQYLAVHAQERELLDSMPMPRAPRVMMLMVGPVIGLVSGTVIGVLSLVASKFIKPATQASAA